MSVKFLVYTDLHVDLMHDTVARMQMILEAAKENQVGYLIQLGDIMYPDNEFLDTYDDPAKRTGWFANGRDDEKQTIRQMIQDSGFKVYGVLGNHDMDACSKEVACMYHGLPAPYYTFDEGGIRFIALDTNYILTNGTYIPFDHCNYKDYTNKDCCWLGTEQLKWLKNQIMESPYPCVLISHAAIADEVLNAHDGPLVWDMIRECNADRRRVIFALNGHNHIDGVCVRSGVPFMSVNSASNIWIGHEYGCIRYSKTISEIYHHMTACAPYWDALYAIITIDEEAIRVQGKKSAFVGPSPYELGFPKERFYHKIRPAVRDRVLPLTAMETEGIFDYDD